MLRQFCIGLICLIGFAASTQAGSTTATIDKIMIYEAGMLVYVYPTGGVTAPPACHGAWGDYLSFSMNRPLAKEYLVALMNAQARNVQVLLVGSGDCVDQAWSETLDYVQLNN